MERASNDAINSSRRGPSASAAPPQRSNGGGGFGGWTEMFTKLMSGESSQAVLTEDENDDVYDDQYDDGEEVSYHDVEVFDYDQQRQDARRTRPVVVQQRNGNTSHSPQNGGYEVTQPRSRPQQQYRPSSRTAPREPNERAIDIPRPGLEVRNGRPRNPQYTEEDNHAEQSDTTVAAVSFLLDANKKLTAKFTSLAMAIKKQADINTSLLSEVTMMKSEIAALQMQAPSLRAGRAEPPTPLNTADQPTAWYKGPATTAIPQHQSRVNVPAYITSDSDVAVTPPWVAQKRRNHPNFGQQAATREKFARSNSTKHLSNHGAPPGLILDDVHTKHVATQSSDLVSDHEPTAALVDTVIDE